jgi:release factor glutamine methyltransferase
LTVTLHETTSRAAARLAAAGIPQEEAQLDAQLLAGRVLGWDRTRLISSWRDPVPAGFAASYDALIARRERREPISQILGEREFWGLTFEVTPDVLTPRPETEGIIEAAHAHCGRVDLIYDLGTGSGCVAIALALEFPQAKVLASDISAAALAVARRNASRHGVAGRILFLHGSVLPPGNRVDLIVSNPPYIPAGQRDSLPPEVRDFEPPEALFAGPDGLDVIRELIQDAPSRLAAGGWLIFECGVEQDRAIREMIARASDLELVDVRPDLAGVPRVVVSRRRRHG